MDKLLACIRRVAPACLLLLLAALAPLHALDADAETKRHARRALLHEAARKHLKLEVGQVEPLEVVLRAGGDFGKADDNVVVLRRGAATAVVVLRGTTPLGCCTFETEGTLALSTQRLAARTWVLLDEVAEHDGESSTLRRLLGLRENELAVRHSWIRNRTTRVGKRYKRELNSELTERDGKLRLHVSTVDYLDDQPMADCRGEQITEFAPQPDGSLRQALLRDEPVPVAVRLRQARILERERLEEAALQLARQARQQCADLPAEDARRLDAASLVARLEARVAPVVAASPK